MRIMLMAFCALVGMTSLAQARVGSSAVMMTFNIFMYNTTESNDGGGPEAESKSSIYDIKGGYLSNSGLYLGGLYTMRSAESAGSKTDGKNMGASIGYIGTNGFFVQGHYIFSAEYGDYKEGSGYQGDFGYIADVTGSVIVGVRATYRTVEYKSDSSKYKKE